MLTCMPGKLVGPASRLVGGLGKEDIHWVIAWESYHSGFLVFDLTLGRKPERDWSGATEAGGARDHWRRPCGPSSRRLWDLAFLSRLGKSRLGPHLVHRPRSLASDSVPNQAEKSRKQWPC
jgi:hypothetical protein